MNGLWQTGEVLDAEWFHEAGFYVHPGFLDAGDCERLRCEMDDSPSVEALVAKRNVAAVLDEHTRRSCCTLVGDELQDMVSRRLVAIAPAVADYFGEAVAVAEAPNFLVYRKGDFFAPHRDTAEGDTMPDYIRRRRLGVILFLNHQTTRPAAGGFCGGTLGFYRLHTRSGGEVVRAGVRARAGTLIAFPSHVVHEVRPVLHGRRYSIVTFYSTPA